MSSLKFILFERGVELGMAGIIIFGLIRHYNLKVYAFKSQNCFWNVKLKFGQSIVDCIFPSKFTRNSLVDLTAWGTRTGVRPRHEGGPVTGLCVSPPRLLIGHSLHTPASDWLTRPRVSWRGVFSDYDHVTSASVCLSRQKLEIQPRANQL